MLSDFNGQYDGYNFGNGQPNGYYDNSYYAHRAIKRKEEKRKIRKLGMISAGAILANLLLQNVFVIFLHLTGLYDRYLNNGFFQVGADIIFSIVCMLLPFLFFGNILKKEAGIEDNIKLNASHDKLLAFLAVPAGLCFCLVANFATSVLVAFIEEGMGVQLSSPELASPDGVFGLFISVIRVSVVAALVEEIAFRGCLMQPLRKHGDGFAVAMAAFTFGLLHGNLIQAPFALISGIGLGYITVKCGSIWPAVIVHAINNLISTVALYAINSGAKEEMVNVVYLLVVYFIILAGGVCALFFYIRSRKYNTDISQESILETKEKVMAYILNPTMIIAIGVMLYYTAQFISAG